MKKLLFIFLPLFISCGSKQLPGPTPQPTATEEKAKPVDTTGSQTIAVTIATITKIDSVRGYAVVKPFVNEKTLQAELQLIRYLDENKNPIAKETKIIGAVKR